jgi:hypothetical protein
LLVKDEEIHYKTYYWRFESAIHFNKKNTIKKSPPYAQLIQKKLTYNGGVK